MMPGSNGGHRGYGLLLTVLCAGIFMVYLDGTVVNVALPQIQADLGGGITELQWVVDIYALAFAALLLTSGVLGDIVGRRRMFLFGLAGFTAASAFCALASSIETLLIARAVQGALGSGLIPISLALITQLYNDPGKRAKMIGLWAGVGGTALAAGPVLGGALLAQFGWQSVFWINVPVGVLATIVLSFLLPRTQPPSHGNIDPLGQLLFISSMALLTFGLIEGNTRGWGSTVIVAAFSGAGLALTAFVWWQRRNRHPLLPLAFFRNPIFMCACVVNFLGLFGLFAVIFLMTLYLQTISGFTPVETGFRLLALTASIMVASALAPIAAKQFGTRGTIIVGSLLFAGGCIGLTRVEVGSEFGTYGWSMALLGVGISLCFAPATIVLLGSVPADQAGTASGVSNTFRQIGGVFGVAMAGAVVLRHLPTSLAPVVDALPVPPLQRERLLNAINRGDFSSLRELPEELRAATAHQVATEFVVGMHTAFVVAAVGALLCGLITFIFMQTRPRHRLYRVTRTRPQEQQLNARRYIDSTVASTPWEPGFEQAGAGRTTGP